MKIEVLFVNIDNNSKEKQYVIKRLKTIERLLQRSNSINCNVRLGKDSSRKKSDNMFFAEATISTESKNYGAKAVGKTIYEAIDVLKDELSKKIRRYKDKKTSIVKKGGRMLKDLLRKF